MSVLNGVNYRVQDAFNAYDLGLAGIVLSNHGGRQLDFARSGIEILVEVVNKFKEKRGIFFPNDRFQLFVDGGVRRATDVLKAVALGATAGTSQCFEIFETRFNLISVQWALADHSYMRFPRMGKTGLKRR
jgi:hypothetical protein